MSSAPTGYVGKLAAERPLLASTVGAVGLTALAVSGVRQAGGFANAPAIVGFILNAIFVVGVPVALFAAWPAKPASRALYLLVTVFAAFGLVAATVGWIRLPVDVPMPQSALTYTALALVAFLWAFAPFTSSTIRRSHVAVAAAILGAAGAAGYMALDGLLLLQEGAAAIALAVTVGASVGVGVNADFARFFARGETQQRAAAAAGHAAVAPAAFSLLTVAALYGVQTLNSNFGAIEWHVLWAGLTAAACAAFMTLIAATGSLSLMRGSEQIAVDENRRRQWFATAWRPVRFTLPPTTAIAAVVIACIVVVIALFEAGETSPFSLVLFIFLVWAAAAVAFVSLRTSLLIAALLMMSSVLAEYGYAAFGFTQLALPERLTALTLVAVALGQLTVNWRDAGDIWRNARDIAQNAMSDGLARYLIVLGIGSASFMLAAHSFSWAEGVSTAVYFFVTASISLLLAPAMMIAMSAKMGRY